MDDLIRIDCDDCELSSTDACADCVVSFVLGRQAEDPVAFDQRETRALRLLQGAGLLPELRHQRRAG